MEKAKAGRILQAGLERQADFVEIFEEETRNAYVSFKDGKVESASAGTDYGIGLRMLYGSQVLYAHSSNEDEEHLIRLLDELAKSRGVSETVKGIPSVHLVGKELENKHKISLDPREVGQAKKLEMLKLANQVAREYSKKVVQVAARAADSITHVLICNSEGLWIEDNRYRSRFSVQVTAEQNGERFTASESPGALRGFEFFEGLDIPYHAKIAAERAVLMLSAGYVEGRQMPVIMGNGFGGVIFHEACGHPLETESIRREASPFVGKLGEKIAHEAVTAVDDGTIPNLWGSINIDDEGMETQRTVLIENGILKNYLSDKVGGGDVKVDRTGSGRRESYQYSPVSRMRNTFIDKGKDKIEDMVTSVDHGLYAKRLGGGSVNPATGEFNFAVEEGYLIEKGKVTKPVRGATLIGKGHEILPKISMVADDLEYAAGMCGASSGSVPVTVGQPTLKVDSILVGGR